MADSHAQPVTPLVRDVYGRRYRVGESDRELVGRARHWMLVTAWLAMFMVSATQYGYGVIVPMLAGTHGWRLDRAFWLLPVWALSQAVAVAALAWWRHRGAARTSPDTRATARWTVLLGGVLCAAGLFTLAYSGDFPLVVLGYGVAGGAGAGLVYGTCLDVIARWYPERPARVGVVSGAFAYGSIPLVLVAGLVSGPRHVWIALDVAGLLVLAACGVAALVLAYPPWHWWPAHLDPKVWAVDKSVNRGLRRNRPAIRTYSPGQVLRCAVAWRMYLVVICASAVALFDIAYLALFAVSSGWRGGYAAIAVAVLAAGSGLARAPAGRACDRFGRDRVLRAALCAGGAAQLLLGSGGEYRTPAVLVIGACLAGASSGVCYALLPGLVGAYFGDDTALANFGVVYSGKAVGAVLGVGLAAFVVLPDGYPAGFAVAAVLSVASAAVLRSLRRPGVLRLSSLIPRGRVAAR